MVVESLIHIGFFKSDITENHSHYIEFNEKKMVVYNIQRALYTTEVIELNN